MIGRKAPLAELARAAGLHTHAFESPSPLIIIYGGASTGKSVGVSQALKTHPSPHTFVDCTALYSAKEFYREALAQLHDVTLSETEEVSVSFLEKPSHAQVDEGRQQPQDEEMFSSLNFLSFFKALDGFMQQNARKGSKQTERVLYLALDHVDKLLDRGLAALITCACTMNDQIAYLNILNEFPPWEVCVLLITRGISMDFDRLVMPFFPVYIHFPPYKPGEIADILVEQLNMKEANDMFRMWLMHLYQLLPAAPDGDWLDFRAAVVHLLPEFRPFFFQPLQHAQSLKMMKNQIERKTKSIVQTFLQTRRKHLFGYHKMLGNGKGDPSELISCTNLSRNCLLLVLAGYLASFNPEGSDVHFLSSSGGQRRKKRVKKNPNTETTALSLSSTSTKKQSLTQLLIGPRIFTLQRLLAIYLNLHAEADATLNDQPCGSETREEVFTHLNVMMLILQLATLVRMQLFQRTTPLNVLDNIKFRCLADARFVHETARYLSFPLDAYLNRAT
ncbi:hypothetical protein PsorP6_016888 [Peronosclerospora sorghi]|uniref:Uncharacterized protein n=1 Tax=Peronosclerospora sorghi TaxID=230839 RepID=A0ACC0WEW6_9STRA|nr:hypothetical protein PsorP6_016888 [Peronosclerospora sorghi]